MIQPFTKADVARMSHLQPDGWHDILRIFQFYVEASFCLPLKIEDNNRIVAVGSLILHTETAWLAHIIVAPDMRRKGLGLMITAELLASAEKCGCNIQLLIATEFGLPLYERLGFRHSCDYVFYHEPVRGALEVPSGIRPLHAADAPKIAALDRKASGEDRGVLLSRHAGTGWVYAGSHGNSIRGYYLPKLGEGIVVAQDAEAGVALMKLRLAQAESAPVLPVGNHVAHEFLRSTGLEPKRSIARMVRNGDDPLIQGMVFNRIGGHLG